jgi:hypothetical protein
MDRDENTFKRKDVTARHFAAHRFAAVSSNPWSTKAAIRFKNKEEKKCDRLRAVTEATAALFSARNTDIKTFTISSVRRHLDLSQQKCRAEISTDEPPAPEASETISASRRCFKAKAALTAIASGPLSCLLKFTAS